ncbi:MAG: DUF4355 domain-containing protein [Paludibacteraceae bacterium]|nr:DUF4355 domain-containing protein [Paludibacteraceae bacterium]
MAEETMSTAQNEQVDTGATSTESANDVSTEVETKSQDVDYEKLIQKAVDRATNKLGNENKKLREELKALKKEKLSEEELKKLELADKEADIADREAKLAEKENRLFAIRAIKEAGLDDGSDMALELVDFVMSNDEDTTRERVETLATLIDDMVSARVRETFKTKGRNPERGGASDSGYNVNHAVITSLGEMAAERNKTTNDVLKHYLGGK